jgi:hypothetical protein
VLDLKDSSEYELKFSPDNRMLAWSARDHSGAHLVEIATGKERCALAGHLGVLHEIAFSPDGRSLVTGSDDTTALVWDLTGRLTGGPDWGKPMSDAQLDAAWAELASDDAAKAYHAIRRLAASPESAVSYLAKQLTPVPAVDEAKVTDLIKELDSDQFETRERVIAELKKLGDVASNLLERARKETTSEEARRRIESLTEEIAKQQRNLTPDQLRALRAVETLEFAGTPAARVALQRMATGAPGARLTEDARDSFERLRKRP